MACVLETPLSIAEALSENASPFTFDDLQKLKTEAMVVDKTSTNGWVFLKKTEHVELWKKATEGSAVNLVKGLLYFPGIPPDVVYQLIVNLDLRRSWEKQIPILEVLDTKPNYRTIYWLVKTPIGASDRDFVQYMTHGHNDDTMYILYKNAVHPSKPMQPGVVRAETIFSGTLIYPDEHDPNSTHLTLVVQDDLKGYIPKTIINYFYSKVPIEWHHNISSYYHKVYNKIRN